MRTYTICVIRPADDEQAETLAGWWERVQTSAPAAADVRDVRGDDATRASVEHHVNGADAVFYFGHGNETGLGDPDNLLDSDNFNKATGSILYAVACKSGRIAEDAVASGIRASLGFWEDLLWTDSFESHFGKAVGGGAAALLAGADVASVLEKMRDAFDDLLEYLKHNDLEHEDWPWAQASAKWDLKILRASGDLSARLPT